MNTAQTLAVSGEPRHPQDAPEVAVTSAELAAYTSESGVDQLSRHAVTELLDRGKTWLRMALERDAAIGDLTDYRAEAAVLRELVIQKQLGKDATLAATELVRRAERAIGQAIRTGQERGEIRRQREQNSAGHNQHRLGQDDDVVQTKPGPSAFVPKHELGGGGGSPGIYDLTDGATDEQFDTAVDEAKAEGNLSRANVARKLKKQPERPSKRPDVLRKTRRFDSRTVIDKTVEAAADVITTSLLDEVNYAELEVEELEQWIGSLTDSIRALNSLKSQLTKELTHR